MRIVCDAVDLPKHQNRDSAAPDAAGVESFLDAAATIRYGAESFFILASNLAEGVAFAIQPVL